MAKNQNVALFGDKTQMPAIPAEDANLGNENLDSSALATPQIKLLQSLSPELREFRDAGATEGMLFNNVTKELMDSVLCANIYLETYVTVWKKRAEGGGKYGEFASEAEAVAHIATLENPSSYDAQETHKHYLVLLDPSTGEPVTPAVVYLKSSQLAVSRNWNTDILNRKAPRFASIWELGSRLERNRRNDEYANYTVEFRGWASAELYAQLKHTYMNVSAARAPQPMREAAA